VLLARTARFTPRDLCERGDEAAEAAETHVSMLQERDWPDKGEVLLLCMAAFLRERPLRTKAVACTPQTGRGERAS